MRIVGKLNLVDTGTPRWCLQLHDPDGCLIAAVPVNDSAGSADAQHLAACWNAIESAGGSPAIVGELVNLVSRAEAEEIGPINPVTGDLRQWIVEARAALKRAKGGA